MSSEEEEPSSVGVVVDVAGEPAVPADASTRDAVEEPIEAPSGGPASAVVEEPMAIAQDEPILDEVAGSLLPPSTTALVVASGPIPSASE